MELSKSQKFFFLSLAILLLIASSLHLHGFSTSEWHSYLDRSKPTELLYGRVRAIRSDDWLLDIPLMLAQTAHAPRFPKINTNIGLGANMMVPLNVPVWNSSLVFRPGNWGFLIGNDFGVSWLWWSKYLGLLAGIYLVLWILTNNSLYSILGSLIFLYAPHTQYWSLHNYEPVIHGALAFSALFFLFRSQKKMTVIVAGILFGWCSVSYVIDNIYPPFQVVAGLFFLTLLIALLVQQNKNPFQGTLKWIRVFSLILGLAIIALGGICFFSEAKDAIELIMNTSYPGRRVSLGGTFPLQMLFTQNVMTTAGIVKDWAQLGNYCEASNFFFFFPALFLFFILNHKKSRAHERIIPYACLGYLIFQLIYTFVGFPLWLAEITLMSKATVNRTQIGLGLSELCLLIVYLNNLKESDLFKNRKALILVSLLFIFGTTFFFITRIRVTHRVLLLLPIIIFSGLSYLLFTPKFKTHFLCALLFLSVVYTFHFNPIVQGGDEYMQTNPLGKKLLEIDKENQNNSLWVIYGNTMDAMVISNYFRIIGLKALVGYFPQPQLEFLKRFDPENKFVSTYNQCAFIRFTDSPSENATFSFEPGNGKINVAPTSKVFSELGVTHFVFTEGVPTSVSANNRFKHLASLDGREIYQLISK